MGWSNEEFWNSTPRIYFAHLYAFSDIKAEMQVPSKPKPLVGKEALWSLEKIARGIK